MINMGEHLKELRNNKGLSLKKVYEKTGITNSRLSKAENGAWDNLKPSEIKKLADLYETPVVQVCLLAGMFDKSDLEEYHSGFKNIALLDDDDKQHIQSEINYILKKRG